MLANTLKRLVFLARSTKRSLPHQSTIKQQGQQKNSEGYSHPISPTLKKIQKRYNQGLKKQQQQEQQLMKSFAELQSNIFQQNQKRKKTKEQKAKQTQEYLKTLQIPQDLRQKLKNRNSQFQSFQSQRKNKTQLNDQDQQKLFQKRLEDNENFKKKAKVHGKLFKTQEQAEQFKRMVLQQQDPLQGVKLRQQMMINQILKGSKQKQAELNLPNSWKKQLEQRKKQKQEQQMLLNEKVRYEKLKEITSQSGDSKSKNNSIRSNTEIKRLDRLNDQYKIQVSPDEVWRSKYAPQLVEAAMEYKNKELSYFKELVDPSQRDIWDDIRESKMLRPTEEQKERKRKNKQLLDAQKEKKNKEIGVTPQHVDQQGLTRYKDLQFYIEKGVKQFQQTENVASYDIELRQAAKKDLDQVNKLSDIFMDEFADPDEVRLQKKQLYQKSTFGKYEIKLKQMSRKMVELGIDHDFEDLALLKKQQLFADKKMQQQNESYKQYLIKKEKKKYMKQELKKIHKQKLREDLNYDYEMDPVKLQKLDPMEMQEGLRKMEQLKKMKESSIVSNEYLKEKIHYTKTLKNMTSFISAYFYNNLQNANNTITQKVQIGNIIPNRKNTVLNVFWQFHPNYMKVMQKYKFNEEDMNQQKKALQHKLLKQSTYISSKMTQYLGLRYGPDIRFYFNEILAQTQQSIQEMKRYKQQIIELTVEEYKQKGLIKTAQQQNEYRQKIQGLATNNLLDINNQKKLLSKVYQKKQRIKEKLQKRKQSKSKKQANNNIYGGQQSPELKSKKKRTQKQLQQLTLGRIITDKVQARKQSIFTPYIQDEQLYFGEEIGKSGSGNMKTGNKNSNNNSSINNNSMDAGNKKKKRSPVQRLWEDIEKGI